MIVKVFSVVVLEVLGILGIDNLFVVVICVFYGICLDFNFVVDGYGVVFGQFILMVIWYV